MDQDPVSWLSIPGRLGSLSRINIHLGEAIYEPRLCSSGHAWLNRTHHHTTHTVTPVYKATESSRLLNALPATWLRTTQTGIKLLVYLFIKHTTHPWRQKHPRHSSSDFPWGFSNPSYWILVFCFQLEFSIHI